MAQPPLIAFPLDLPDVRVLSTELTKQGEHLVIMQCDVGVFDGSFFWLRPLVSLLLRELCQVYAHMIIGSTDTVEFKRAVLGVQIGGQCQMEIGMVGALEPLAHDGQAGRLLVEMVAQALAKDRRVREVPGARPDP
jgi:hypothetical protein